MALKQVLLHRKRAALVEKLREAEQTRDELKQKRDELTAKELETEEAINEITEETSEEDKAAVEEQADELIQQSEELKEQETENEKQRDELQEQINQLDAELNEIENRAKQAGKKTRSVEPGFVVEERKEVGGMETRKFFGLNYTERDALLARDDVKKWFSALRAASQNRAVDAADLFIPRVVMGLVRENVGEYSKLLKHVNVRNVPGEGRVLVAGTVPEAVWTATCAKLNELAMSYSMVALNGNKVGGYIPVCNAVLEDATDPVAIGTEVMTALNQSVGFAMDKAIGYGTGVGMPLGIVTRLMQAADPGAANGYQRPWKDLRTSNVTKITATEGADLFKGLVLAAAKASSKYSNGSKFWAMNERTKATMVAGALSINAAGAVVSGVQSTMPVIGGVIETLDWMPDNVIFGGYGDMYTVAERAGTRLDKSEHVRFTEDQTVFRVTARYDGLPVIPEAFVGITLGDATLAADAVTFAPDEANS